MLNKSTHQIYLGTFLSVIFWRNLRPLGGLLNKKPLNHEGYTLQKLAEMFQPNRPSSGSYKMVVKQLPVKLQKVT